MEWQECDGDRRLFADGFGGKPRAVDVHFLAPHLQRTQSLHGCEFPDALARTRRPAGPGFRRPADGGGRAGGDVLLADRERAVPVSRLRCYRVVGRGVGRRLRAAVAVSSLVRTGSVCRLVVWSPGSIDLWRCWHWHCRGALRVMSIRAGRVPDRYRLKTK